MATQPEPLHEPEIPLPPLGDEPQEDQPIAPDADAGRDAGVAPSAEDDDDDWSSPLPVQTPRDPNSHPSTIGD